MEEYGGGRPFSPISLTHHNPPHLRNETHASTDSESDYTQTPTNMTDLSIDIISTIPLPLTTVSAPSSITTTVRKPRGRPPGSKNKPKAPMIITRKDETAMHVTVLEVKSGTDIVNALVDFARRRRIGVTILGGSGTVSSLVLRHNHHHHPGTSSIQTPNTASTSTSNNSSSSTTYSLHGQFDIVTLSATILAAESSAPSTYSGFNVAVAGPQGTVYGGCLVGGLIAYGTVVVFTATFGTSEIQTLSMQEKNESDGGGEDTNNGSSSSCKINNNNSIGVGSGMVMFPWSSTGSTRLPPPLNHDSNSQLRRF
ncbi:hypothetical protein ZOSMA_216G00130 [Zostera marina]|uniref:PPC domain-containing protein n=1 Tax=Zostera marina TaxID=29655 RepID=A0A0K9PJW1_ZOSMR|nr:hypothetical protein ZOSMA_216G00130 [Zostera marina]